MSTTSTAVLQVCYWSWVSPARIWGIFCRLQWHVWFWLVSVHENTPSCSRTFQAPQNHHENFLSSLKVKPGSHQVRSVLIDWIYYDRFTKKQILASNSFQGPVYLLWLYLFWQHLYLLNIFNVWNNSIWKLYTCDCKFVRCICFTITIMKINGIELNISIFIQNNRQSV